MREALHIYIVDDDAAVRASLRLLLEAYDYSVEEHDSADSFLRVLDKRTKQITSDCALVDVHMPNGMDGIELLQEVKRRGIFLPVLIITGRGDVPMAVKAMRAGAQDFIEKPYSEDQIIAAVEAMHIAGKKDSLSDRSRTEAARKIAVLGPREREVFDFLVNGLSNKQIAAQMGISHRTVETHRASIMQRLEVASLAEAVRIAFLAGVSR